MFVCMFFFFCQVQQEIKEFGKGVTGVPFFRVSGPFLAFALVCMCVFRHGM